jgi:hypothetical protein
MPQAIFIKGCGRMACATYAEVVAAMDRAYALPRDQPLPVDQIFASLAREADCERPSPEAFPPAPPPAPTPEPG